MSLEQLLEKVIAELQGLNQKADAMVQLLTTIGEQTKNVDGDADDIKHYLETIAEKP